MRGNKAEATEHSGGDQDETKPQSRRSLEGSRRGSAGDGHPLVNTLRGLLQNVGSLLQAVVSWLRRILAALRDGLGSVVGKCWAVTS